MSWERPLTLTYPFPGARPYHLSEKLLRRWLDQFEIHPRKTSIAAFDPVEAYAGTAMVISGFHFSPNRADNQVTVGGLPALVVEASKNRLFVLTDAKCKSGPVEVTVAGVTATGPQDFVVKPWPAPGQHDVAPPYSFEGRGIPGSGLGGAAFPGGDPNATPGAGDIAPTGTARVLVVLCNPTDMVPANPTQVRNDVITTFANVHTFYDQVSYGTLDFQADVTTFVSLLEDADYYHRPNGGNGYPNIDEAVMEQLTAEAAQGAVNQGYDLDDYEMMAVLVHLPGLAVRAWGGWSQQYFSYNDGAGTVIYEDADSPLAMICARHDASWGRVAHELGHCLVSGGLILAEDVYASDLVDPSAATAQMFDIMGSHESRPLFSGFYLDQLNYYSGANFVKLQWDRNHFAAEYLVTAHGTAQDATPDRVHLIRIRVSYGLDYYIEVRQRPPAGSAQVFDTDLPIPVGSSRTGGVVVTKALSGQQYNNQQMRLITLLHEDPVVLLTGQTATDPLRDLKITVVDDQVSTDPLTCRVRIEWAEQINDTPGGDFDLWMTPWGPGWESEDIWIDRIPYGTYDSVDAAGNPTGNGDVPKAMEVNHFWGRVHNSGLDASDVKMTFYSVSPPGVGDNGTWTPIRTETLPSVPGGGTTQACANWVPVMGEHTCLKVVVEPQYGEQLVGNNQAQENVFTFQLPGQSVPEPVAMPVCVRNPCDTEAVVHVRITGVPEGYHVYLPHRWVELAPRGEFRMDLLVVPTADLEVLRANVMKVRRIADRKDIDPWPRIRVQGQISRGYLKAAPKEVPGSWWASIGGISARVEPKRMAAVKLAEDREYRDSDLVAVRGSVSPAVAGQAIRVDLAGSDGRQQFAEVVTDDDGHFRAQFQIKQTSAVAEEERPVRWPERLGLDPNIRVREVDPGRLGRLGADRLRRVSYQVQAHVIHADYLAPASSNVVVIRRLG